MSDLPNLEIEIFWENKIRALLTNKGLMTDEAVVEQLDGWVILICLKDTWTEIEEHATDFCFNIYDRVADANNPAPTNFAELMADLAPDENGKTALEEYQEIRQKTMLKYEAGLIEANKSVNFTEKVLKRLLEDVLKYEPTDDDQNLTDPRLCFLHLKKNVLKNRSLGKILKKERRLNQIIDKRKASLKTLLGLGVNDNLPTDWATQLVKKTDLDTANAQITTLTTKRDNQKTRADTLQSWKDSHNCSAPACSHTDYDTIKQERDQLKSDKESHNCDYNGKVQAKESQIINKIITDLGLSTEKERENLLEAVIAEIKTKITPPTNNPDKSKISQLETEITNLKKPAPEVVAKMTEFSQELNLTDTKYQEKLSQAENYQQLFSIQSEAFKEKLTSEISNKNSAESLNIALGVLSIGSLLLLAYLLIKGTKFSNLEDNKKGVR